MAAARAVPPKAEAVADRFSGNPIRRGWYATPDAAISGKQYRIHPTYSAAYEKQLVFGASSSPDLVTWTKHLHVLDAGAVSWVKKALWAPAIAQKEGKYYLFFSANDMHRDSETGGIGVAVADRPQGPFKRTGRVLQQDPSIATGAGHHSLLHTLDEHWYIVCYHRPKGETVAHHRAVGIDRLHFDAKGPIPLVKITRRGVEPQDIMQALRQWHKEHPELFVKRPNNQTGLDI